MSICLLLKVVDAKLILQTKTLADFTFLVMRLTRPTLVGPQVITCEPKDLPHFSLRQSLENEGTTVAGAETLAVGQFMLLPQSFGNIYLGETFSSYICVHNCTSHAVEGVSVKADLQSNSTRISLPMHENKSKPATLAPDETLDDVIRYEVKEIGTHVYVFLLRFSNFLNVIYLYFYLQSGLRS